MSELQGVGHKFFASEVHPLLRDCIAANQWTYGHNVPYVLSKHVLKEIYHTCCPTR